MLAADAKTAYISEPLNVWHREGVFRQRIEHWYAYITEENEARYLPGFTELLKFRYHLLAEVGSIRSGKDLLRMGRDLAIFTDGKLRGKRVLIKDPFAAFSAPWFAEKFNSRVVVTIRHPAGFVSSIKRLNWPFDFHNLLDQPCLMRDHLEKDRADMETIKPQDVVGQSALLWRMIYRFVHSTRSLHPDFKIIRHEDLSLDPITGYQALYDSLGLLFDDRVRDIILNSSGSENPKELSKKKVHSVKLDSRANMDNWKKRLTAEEIIRIRRMTEEVSHLYYSDEEWK